MKRIFLILSALIALPVSSLQPAIASSWSWKNLASTVNSALGQKTVLIGLGAAALAGVVGYNAYRANETNKPKLPLQMPNPTIQSLYGMYIPALNFLQITENQKKAFKTILLMLKKAAEMDMGRLSLMLSKNMHGSVSFDCLHVWNAHQELAQTLPLIQQYTFNIKQFSDVALTTQQDVQHAYAHVKSLHRAVEKLIQN